MGHSVFPFLNLKKVTIKVDTELILLDVSNFKMLLVAVSESFDLTRMKTLS